jgi:DNA-binding beta-propeller fold protein YncE
MRALFFILACSLAISSAAAAEAQTLKLLHTIPLPGVKGRFDHFAIDPKGQRLFVAALGNDTLEILDIAQAKRLHSITGLHKPTGVLYLANENQIAVANGDDGTFRIYSGQDYKSVVTVNSLDDADNVRFDAQANRVYVGYGDGALAVIDPMNWSTLATIKLGAHPESFQLEREGKRIFVNLPDAKQVAVIDRDKQSVIAGWPMEKFQANFPMALDESSHRLFVGCRKPPRLLVFDTQTGKAGADFEISGDTDDLFFDPKRNRVYVSCGEGYIDTLQFLAGNTAERLPRLQTRPGARTSFFSPDLGAFCLAVPQQGANPAAIRIFQVTDSP